MVYVIAALLGIGGWLLALLTRALFVWAVTARYQRKYGTPEKLAQVRAPIDAILGGVVDEPIRFAGIWWLIAVTAAGSFTMTATSTPSDRLLLGLCFALGWAGAEIVHLLAVIKATQRTADAEIRSHFAAAGLADAKSITLRIAAALLRNIGLTLIVLALPLLVLVTLTARAAAALLAVRNLVNAVDEKPHNLLLTSGFLAGALFALAGGILIAVS